MKITSAEYITSGTTNKHYVPADKPEFVLLGRSNVGKSSFINSLLNRKKLAYTSSRPGKTQTLSWFLINNNFYFVDVPGYGYAKVSKKKLAEFGAMIEEYLTTRKVIKRVYLLVDLRHKPTSDDHMMYDFLKYYNLPVTIIATKADKIPKTHLHRHIKQVKTEIDLAKGDLIIPYSSETLLGKDEVLSNIERYLK